MYFKGEKVLVLGLGISGISTVRALDKLGANIVVVDSKNKEDLEEFFLETVNIEIEEYLGGDKLDLSDIDLIIKSPGIKPNNPLLLEARELKIDIITDIELAYRISPTKNIITITGTNGKTTTTTLVGSIFQKVKRKTYLTGNIGVGILEKIVDANEEDVFVIEASSFQLENTIHFKPKVGLILNITPDHLDWHGSMENYILAKTKVYKNQAKDEYIVLNSEDDVLKQLSNEINSNIIWFSVHNKLDKGIYIENEIIVYNDGEKTRKVIEVKDIPLLGEHNIENIMGAIGISIAMDIDILCIKQAIKEFVAVEHRIEYVDEINKVKFYNDSKGTNPESTMKAIEAMKGDISLIAGGYDKGSSYDELIESFNNKVKNLVLLGETKYKIEDTAKKYGLDNIYLVDTMEEAIYKAFEESDCGMNVLLSPACASWGMYKSFEERGRNFKDIVKKLKEENIG